MANTHLSQSDSPIQAIGPLVARLSDDGAPPADDNLFPRLQPTSVVQSAGGRQLDHAQLQWIHLPLVDRDQPSEFTRAARVSLPPTVSNPAGVTLLVGDFVSETETVNENGETLAAEVHLRNYHFGEPFRGQRWWNQKTGDDLSLIHI